MSRECDVSFFLDLPIADVCHGHRYLLTVTYQRGSSKTVAMGVVTSDFGSDPGLRRVPHLRRDAATKEFGAECIRHAEGDRRQVVVHSLLPGVGTLPVVWTTWETRCGLAIPGSPDASANRTESATGELLFMVVGNAQLNRCDSHSFVEGD